MKETEPLNTDDLPEPGSIVRLVYGDGTYTQTFEVTGYADGFVQVIHQDHLKLPSNFNLDAFRALIQKPEPEE